MPDGSIFKRCGCRHPDTGKPLGNACPRLRRANGAWSAGHGQWAYQLELPPTGDSRRRQLRRAGLHSHHEAGAELDHARALLALAGRHPRRSAEIADLLQQAVRARQPLPEPDSIRQRLRGDALLGEAPTVGDYLTSWLENLHADANTVRGYASIARVHLIPHLGQIALDQLRTGHIRAMFAAIEVRNAAIAAARTSPDPTLRHSVAGVRPTGPATRQRIRAVLRKAINDALADELIVGSNPAALVKIPGDRARPMVWEDERVAAWQATGVVPGPVMVWTAAQVAAFLDHAAAGQDPDLHPMLHLMAYRGLRRGEACGLRDTEVRLGKHEITINNQIATHGHTPVQKPPKSKAGHRDVALDADTVAVLAGYRARRAAWRLAAAAAWPDTGLFFVRPDGRAWHPNAVTQRFRKLVRASGLPPIRLHDLRHAAASIALDAGIDIKVVAEQLGHSTTTLTRDTYQSVAKHLHHTAADAVAERLRNTHRRNA